MSGLGFGKNCFLPLTIHILGDQPFASLDGTA